MIRSLVAGGDQTILVRMGIPKWMGLIILAACLAPDHIRKVEWKMSEHPKIERYPLIGHES